ncbi:DUF1385 domain-containing protein [Proteiniclasticum sp. BAD-10]|uniref:DUF1385 domain-containing protein n=1 Tax=Proteiniclasticum sediminis TaxID=2804028 RepID=A0A941HQN2_9CLOT|nr:DUF1385 domain-containing protein [Proteiniclasticum sediminis]MBR0576689.1 DUF1385 domain-containing protein [Proteiniclasticum sediminis]
MKETTVGGQAVIEGVMMRGKKGISTAVRNPLGDIVVHHDVLTPLSQRHKAYRLPLIRGAVALVDSMRIGIRSLNWSASVFGADEEPTKLEKMLRDKFGEKGEKMVETLTLLFSLGLSILIFFVLPTLITGVLKNYGLPPLALNTVEALLRLTIFIGYLYGISQLKDIYRVFQYHGAEHKAIVCYEMDMPLTVENVKTCSRFHERCGTNFMFLVMAVSILVFSFTGWSHPLLRVVLRILLLPVISGITYEILRWLGRTKGPIQRVVAYPGMMLQRLTTKEPLPEMLEVSIRALKEAEGLMDDEN